MTSSWCQKDMCGFKSNISTTDGWIAMKREWIVKEHWRSADFPLWCHLQVRCLNWLVRKPLCKSPIGLSSTLCVLLNKVSMLSRYQRGRTWQTCSNIACQHLLLLTRCWRSAQITAVRQKHLVTIWRNILLSCYINEVHLDSVIIISIWLLVLSFPRVTAGFQRSIFLLISASISIFSPRAVSSWWTVTPRVCVGLPFGHNLQRRDAA